jgi:hypothetical protein
MLNEREKFFWNNKAKGSAQKLLGNLIIQIMQPFKIQLKFLMNLQMI